MRKIFSVLFIFLLVLFAFPNIAKAQVQNDRVNLTQIDADIELFLTQLNAQGYLLWQYSGEQTNAFAADPYSFYRDSPICGLLKTKSDKFSSQGKFIGVNMWDVAASLHSDDKIRSAFGYLSNSCGVKVVRIFANDALAGPSLGNLRRVLAIAGETGIQIIIALADYNGQIGGTLTPANLTQNPTIWYSSTYVSTGYLAHATSVAQNFGNNSAVYGFELMNEPHCSGLTDCLSGYNSWAATVSSRMSEFTSKPIGIGQKASENTTRGDSPGVGVPPDFAASNAAASITMASGHYYTTEQRDLVQAARGLTTKQFYVGEAGTYILDEEPVDDFEIRDIPCDQTYEPEFHSLRPYPASPCKKDPEPTYYMCGQELVVKEVLNFTPSNATFCEPLADGRPGQKCYFSVRSSANVALGLTNANFPIMGNTELVPNSTNTGSAALPLSGKPGLLARVNEYASWYLNGISFRAEEIPATIDQIINLSGPLKKLLPRVVQTEERNNERGRIGVDRHNQIVSCGDTTDPQACYRESNRYNRITNVPPDPNNASFPYIPFSSTEDRVGSAIIDVRPLGPTCANPHPSDPNLSGVTCLDFTAQDTTKSLYFPHIEEVNELGKTLQGTFKPSGIDDAGTAPQDQWSELVNTPYCELVESRTNPGDRLYGELARNGEEPINGSMSYEANLQCEFVNPTPDEVLTCTNNCLGLGRTAEQCALECNTSTTQCEREIFIPFSVQITTPELKTTWERLVAGSMSVVKRIFPKVGTNTPIEILKDIPGESNAGYSSGNTGVSGGGLTSSEGLAGNPAEMRPGSTAKIFFPHIGSVYDYFLHGIQQALRPKGIVYEDEILPGEEANCQITGANFQSQELLKIIADAAKWAHIPVELLTMIVEKEGCGYFGSPNGLCGVSDAEVIQYSAAGATYPRNCRPAVSGASGPMQIRNDVFSPFSQAVNLATQEGRTPNNCNIKDSIYAAAWILSAGYSPLPTTPVNYNVANSPLTWTLAEMQRSITKWGVGYLRDIDGDGDYNDEICKTHPDLSAACYVESYCAQIIVHNQAVTSTCNSKPGGSSAPVPSC